MPNATVTESEAAAPTTAPARAGFAQLDRSGPGAGSQVGCLFTLAAILLLVGVGLLVAFIINPNGKGDMSVVPIVGGAFALVGAVLLLAAVRGARGLGIAPTEVLVEGGPTLQPGERRRVRVRQPGPVTIDSLTLRIACERAYQRRVKAGSASTVEDHETLWERMLLEVAGERVPSGGVLERDAMIELPAGALPTGPAPTRDGDIRWKLEILGDAGVLRAIFHSFALVVTAGASEAHP